MDKRKYFSEQQAFRPGWAEAEPVAMLGIVENSVNAGYWKGKETSGALLWTASMCQDYLVSVCISFVVPFLLFPAAADAVLVLNHNGAPVWLLSWSCEF